jgi:predicted metal-binding membrane protein
VFTRRGSGRIVDDVDSLSDGPSGNRAEGWIYGVLCAAPLAALGIYNVVARHAWWFRLQSERNARHEETLIVVSGTTAVWLGAAIIATALTIHFHSFWGNHPRLSRYYEPLKFVGITAMCITFTVFGVLYFRRVGLG